MTETRSVEPLNGTEPRVGHIGTDLAGRLYVWDPDREWHPAPARRAPAKQPEREPEAGA
jgi:hypothetical protein